MPTDSIIEYDLDTLAELTAKDLQIQVIARMDLDRPKREHDLDAATYRAAIVAEVDIFVKQLETLGVPGLAEGLAALRDGFVEGGGS